MMMTMIWMMMMRGGAGIDGEGVENDGGGGGDVGECGGNDVCSFEVLVNDGSDHDGCTTGLSEAGACGGACLHRLCA